MLRNVRLAKQINYFTPIARRAQTTSRLGANGFVLAGAAFSATAAALWLHLGDHALVWNDSEASFPAEVKKIQSTAGIVQEDSLDCLVWGSNRNALIVPNTSKSIRLPQPSAALLNTAVRDLKLHESHGACVDARGDLYQWGSGFSQEITAPQKTLSGLDLSSLALTESKVYALSRKSGRMFLVSSNKEKQHNNSRKSESWLSLLGISNNPTDFVEIIPDSKLASKEKFVSVQAGSDHLVALTSNGRTFAIPTSLRANSHGQLGFRKPEVRMTTSCSEAQQVELNPDAVRDPMAMATPFRRSVGDVPLRDTDRPKDVHAHVLDMAESDRHPAEDNEIRFCTKLTEVPALRGIQVSQIAAGRRSTYARIDGRVLSWGANEYGQLGLGSALTLPYVTVPSEISFARNTKAGTSSSCLSLASAGDVAYFLVKRQGLGMDSLKNEVLACGQGQGGALGNGQYSSAQSDLVRIKAVSGLMEFSEQHGKVLPVDIHSVNTSPTGHTMLAFETLSRAGPGGVRGRDMLIWGQNKDYELGNGKRNIQATPCSLNTNSPDMRFMLLEKEAEVKDMSGKKWSQKALVRQTPLGGFGCTVVYWKVVD